jgi:hypothetical protein
VDDAQGVITAIKTTPGSIAEQSQLETLIDQHQANTSRSAQTVIADHKYGTVANFISCQKLGLRTHLGDVQAKQAKANNKIFPEEAFTYQAKTNCYICPAGQTLQAHKYHGDSWEYRAATGVCLACPLRRQCTRSKTGRTLKRYREQELLDRARQQSHSAAGRADRKRRQELMERSFADAVNNHGFKRSRWRRLWRQEIQDFLIAAIQNIRIMIKNNPTKLANVASAIRAAVFLSVLRPWKALERIFGGTPGWRLFNFRLFDRNVRPT